MAWFVAWIVSILVVMILPDRCQQAAPKEARFVSRCASAAFLGISGYAVWATFAMAYFFGETP